MHGPATSTYAWINISHVESMDISFEKGSVRQLLVPELILQHNIKKVFWFSFYCNSLYHLESILVKEGYLSSSIAS